MNTGWGIVLIIVIAGILFLILRPDKPKEKGGFRLCPKCQRPQIYLSLPIGTSFCSECGTPMVKWTLTCECGKLISPDKSPYNSHCEHCGKPTTKLIEHEYERIQKTAEGAE